MTLQDIKETKRYGRTQGRTSVQTDVKTVYPPQTKFAGGITKVFSTCHTINCKVRNLSLENELKPVWVMFFCANKFKMQLINCQQNFAADVFGTKY